MQYILNSTSAQIRKVVAGERRYRVAVHLNGQLMLGSAYTKQLALNPGDEA